MKRRDFIAGLAGAAVWSAALAQQAPKSNRLKMLLPRAGMGEQESVAAGLQRLEDLGWRDGENIQIDRH